MQRSSSAASSAASSQNNDDTSAILEGNHGEANQEDDGTDSEEGEEPSVKLGDFSKTEGSSSACLLAAISDKRHGKGLKKVRFNSTSKMVLIPCVADYRKAGLTNTLWWTTDEYFTFQQAASSEIK